MRLGGAVLPVIRDQPETDDAPLALPILLWLRGSSPPRQAED